MDYREKIKSLKLSLPPAPKPAGSYRPAVIAGDIAFLSGQISKTAEGRVLAGKVGQDLTLDEGKAAARVIFGEAKIVFGGLFEHFQGKHSGKNGEAGKMIFEKFGFLGDTAAGGNALTRTQLEDFFNGQRGHSHTFKMNMPFKIRSPASQV